MIVQVYEVTSAKEARACAAAGVDHIGVLVGPGAFPRELALEEAREILATLPAGAKGSALSLSPDPETIAAAIDITRPDILHLGAAPEKLTVDDVRALKSAHPRLSLMRSIPVVGAESVDLARSYDGLVDFLLLDSHDPGDPQIGALGRVHDWSISARIVEAVAVPCILAGGLGPDNVVAAIRAVGPAGIDSKTLTDRPGGHVKDLDAVRRFADAARNQLDRP